MAKRSKALLVAATELELCGHRGLACGIGPIEAAVTTARALALEPRAAVVHVGIAGARGITPGGLVIGSEAVYCDIAAAISVIDQVEPDPELLAAVKAALPNALTLPIGTSAAVGGGDTNLRVEAMEGFAVLRACARSGTPAIELRAISNEISERDRSRWRIERALEALAEAIPSVLEAVAQ